MSENKIIKKIIDDAENERERLLSEASERASIIRGGIKTQISQITSETDLKISEKIKLIEKQTESVIVSERRKIKLSKREKVYLKSIKDVKKHFTETINKPEFENILSAWIAEGCISVNFQEMYVRSSSNIQISDQILKKSVEIVKEYTGKDIILTPDRDNYLFENGISVLSSDMRVSYTNTVESRIRRFKDDINRIISSDLEKERLQK